MAEAEQPATIEALYAADGRLQAFRHPGTDLVRIAVTTRKGKSGVVDLDPQERRALADLLLDGLPPKDHN